MIPKSVLNVLSKLAGFNILPFQEFFLSVLSNVAWFDNFTFSGKS